MRKSHLNDEFLVLFGPIISRFFSCSNEEKNKTKQQRVFALILSLCHKVILTQVQRKRRCLRTARFQWRQHNRQWRHQVWKTKKKVFLHRLPCHWKRLDHLALASHSSLSLLVSGKAWSLPWEGTEKAAKDFLGRNTSAYLWQRKMVYTIDNCGQFHKTFLM